jgi:hypothetical protein
VGFGVFVAAGLVFVPTFAVGAYKLFEQDCETTQSAFPFGALSEGLDCAYGNLGNGAAGGFVSLIIAVVVTIVIMGIWRRQHPASTQHR